MTKMKSLRVLATIVYFFSISTFVYAQGKTVRGKVVSEEGRGPLPGWTIIEPGTNNHTSTDANGEFTLQLTSSPAIIRVPECFTPLYVEYPDTVSYKEIVVPVDLASAIYKESKRVEEKMRRARPTREVRGIVLDKKTKQPIEGCLIKVSNSETHVYSDDEGLFSLSVPNNTLVKVEITKGKSQKVVTYEVDEEGKKIMF
jgi:hypothetical protein